MARGNNSGLESEMFVLRIKVSFVLSNATTRLSRNGAASQLWLLFLHHRTSHPFPNATNNLPEPSQPKQPAGACDRIMPTATCLKQDDEDSDGAMRLLRLKTIFFCDLHGYCTRLIVLGSTTTQKRSRRAKEQPSRASMKSSGSESRHGTHIKVLQTPEPAIAPTREKQ